MIWKNGQQFSGRWSSGLQHGYGTLYDSNYEIVSEGNWINGQFVN
jgi:hypothetical protein